VTSHANFTLGPKGVFRYHLASHGYHNFPPEWLVKRFFVLAIVSSLSLVAAAVSPAQAAEIPYPAPVYASCPTSNGTPAHLIIYLQLDNQAGLTRFLDDAYYNPSSPSYHAFLSASQFDAMYSAPSSVFSSVESILASNGLSTIMTGPMLIEGAGTDGQAQSALTQIMGTANIQRYLIGSECIPEGLYTLSSSNSHVPSYTPDHHRGAYVGSSQSRPKSCAFNEPSQYGQTWFPCGLQAIYDETPLLSQGPSGSHQTIALVDAFGDPEITQANSLVYDNIACSDLATFNSDFNLPNSNCSVIYPTGSPTLTATDLGDAENWGIETALDMQYSHTMAPAANILEVTTPTGSDDFFASVEYVVNNNLANTISLSWGYYEDLFYCFSPPACSPPNAAAFMTGYDEIFQQAAAQGIGVFASSGDYGAYDPVFAPPPTGEVSTSSPASDPWVTGVGGTRLTATLTGNSISRLEAAWSFPGSFPGCLCGSGGGFSMVFHEPLDQQMVHIATQVSSIFEPLLGTSGITFYPQGQRGVPDLAADADPATGVLFVLDGAIFPYAYGGTSLAAPLTAGMSSLVQGNTPYFTIGDLAPTLYQLYSHDGGFYTYQSQFGISQLSHGIHGVMFLTASGQNGVFHVTPGVWNPVAGLGQLNVYGLALALSSSDYGD